jgi:Nucleotidyl transferase AbiEii toxin, Type IV TA system
MAMDFPWVLGRIATHVEAGGHRLVLAGGLAMQALGSGRATQDLDLVTDTEVREGLVGFMESLGYETLYRSLAFSNHVHRDSRLGRVDFIYVDPHTAQRLIGDARSVEWFGQQVLVPSAEHMIAMKVHAVKNDRTRDLRELADIRFLLERDGVDRARVRGYFEAAGLWEKYGELL